MTIGFVPQAEASIGTLMASIDRVIINPIIFLLFALALVIFLYGVMQYLMNPDNEEVRSTSKSHMMWGVVGLFIMVAVFGIMRIILNTVGEKRININDTGQIQINK
jgi:predicted membrane channel-forming protein YqfA (hemolysin III family)